MFCEKCGNKLPEQSKFCPKCGTPCPQDEGIEKINENDFKENKSSERGENLQELQETERPKKSLNFRKKWILPVGLLGLFVVLGIIILGISLNSNKSALKAYKEFYKNYYRKNAGDLSEKILDEFDCPGRIVMGKDNEMMMLITDIKKASKKTGGKGSVYLYGYEWGKVVQKAELRNLKVYDEKDIGEIPVRAVTLGNHLYLVGADAFLNMYYEDKPFTRYIFDEKEEEFEEVRWKIKKNTKEAEQIVEYETEQGDSSERWYYLSGKAISDRVNKGYFNRESAIDSAIISATFSITGDDFEYILEKLQEEKIKNDTDLQLFYGRMKEDMNVKVPGYDYEETDYPIATIVESKDGYYGIRTSGKASLLGVKNYKKIEDISKVLEKVDGRIVTRIEGYALANCPNLKEITIPDNIKHVGKKAFAYCENLKSVKISDGVTEIGTEAFAYCDKLGQVEIPDSVEKIGKNIVGILNYDDDLVTYGKTIVANENSEAYKYAKEKNINCSAQPLSKEDIEENVKIAEALNLYEKEFSNINPEGLYDSKRISLIYLNNDKIPECIAWVYEEGGDWYHCYGKLWSYNGGELQEQDLEIEHMGIKRGFYYTPQSGDFYTGTWNNGYGPAYKVGKLTDHFEVVEEILDYQAALPNEIKYTINGEDVGSTEAIEQHLASLNIATPVTEGELYKSVEKAWMSLQK